LTWLDHQALLEPFTREECSGRSLDTQVLVGKAGPGMTVSVRIPTILRTFTGGAAEVTADSGTLREVLAGLDASYPGIGGRIVDDSGQLRRFVNVYVGEEDVRFAQGLDTPVPAGANVSVIPAVAGG
jgi:molybdopterin converting factor small subunit